jgi:pyruvate formate lyase activating enzyme
MDIKGWVRTSLIDFPGHIAAVVFTGGCNLRCPMCHNSDLVLRPGELLSFDLSEIWDFLRRRAGKVTGLVVTGGEPTLHPDLAAFLAEARDLGYAVKVDTNGYRPDVLAALLDQDLVDFVAMDVKAPPESYDLLAGLPDIDLELIAASLSLLCEGRAPVEFRTTVVPGLLAPDDIEAIARWLAGLGAVSGATYVLQQFRGGSTLDAGLAAATPYTSDELRQMAERARRWLSNVTVRGI